MAFGILEDDHLSEVPGTGILSDHGVVHGNEIAINEAANLKRGTGRHAHIVLMPQPSDDPRDPLNWPTWKKEGCFWTLAFVASLDGALSPLVSAGYVVLAQQFDISVDDVTSTFGTILLGLATFMLFQGALAEKWGHRIVYLGSVFLMFISCIWCAASPSLASIRASRVFQGFGMSAFQSLTANTIEQVYFIHERGNRSTIWSFSLLIGITIYVIENLSWQWGFWIVSIPLGISVLLVFFLVPETTFHRLPAAIADDKSSEQVEKASDAEKSPTSIGEAPAYDSSVTQPQRPSYRSELKIWSGSFSNQSFWRIFLRPIPFIFSPVTVFVFLAQGMQTVWLSTGLHFGSIICLFNNDDLGLVPLCSSTIFTIEYGFTPSQIGLTNLGGLVGIIIGVVITGPLLDSGVVWLSKRNRGIYEPEFRIVFVSSMLFGTFGYVGWAVGTSHGMPWIGAVACITMLNFSMIVSGSAAITYLLDTHGSNAVHCLAISNFSKNMVLYGSTYFANGMVENRGVKVALLILGACHTFCFLGSIPMYIFGKRVRSFIARHPNFFVVDDN